MLRSGELERAGMPRGFAGTSRGQQKKTFRRFHFFLQANSKLGFEPQILRCIAPVAEVYSVPAPQSCRTPAQSKISSEAASGRALDSKR